MKNNKKITREQWLEKALKELNKRVFKPIDKALDLDKIKISCGFPPNHRAGSKMKTVGVCFPDTTNGFNEIFINPCVSKSGDALSIVAHEGVHARLNCEHGHGKPFRDIAIAIGLEGKMTSTHAGENLKAIIKEITKKIGEYPHEELKVNHKKQGTRMLKVHCPTCLMTSGDDYITYTTNKQIQKGTTFCPEGHKMKVAVKK